MIFLTGAGGREFQDENFIHLPVRFFRAKPLNRRGRAQFCDAHAPRLLRELRVAQCGKTPSQIGQRVIRSVRKAGKEPGQAGPSIWSANEELRQRQGVRAIQGPLRFIELIEVLA